MAQGTRRLLLPVVVTLCCALLCGCGAGSGGASQDSGGEDVAATGQHSDAAGTKDSATCPCDTSKDHVCARNTCQADGTCAFTPVVNGTPCSDGDPCTVGDSCADGACKPGSFSACECRKNSDCSDDGDACNGLPFCDKATLPWRCAVNPATVVTCGASDQPCTLAGCDKNSGKCTVTNQPDGTACDDGDACTSDDGCTAGACTGTETCSCTSTADCKSKEDGNPCNGTLFCDKKTSTCAINPATVVQCDDSGDTLCRKNTCQPVTGVCMPVAVPGTTACDDGDKCTAGDHCSGGSCAPGKSVCTCKVDADCAAHDDGDKCNGLKFCDKATGSCKDNPASVVSCPSVADTACAHNVCLPKEGTCTMTARADVTLHCAASKDAFGKPVQVCKWQLKTAGTVGDSGPFLCDDGDTCTSGEVCAGTSCKASAVTCKCKSNADCANADDGDLCNGTYYCNKSLKVPDCAFNPASVVLCSKKDDTDCLQAACDPKTGACGLAPVVAGKPCDPGDACKVAAKCDGKGDCSGGSSKGCNDNDVCTDDSCDAKLGCVFKANIATCDDGVPCTLNDQCDGGTCKGAPRQCDDGNACTLTSCDSKTGQCKVKKRPDGHMCNADNNGCTINDACAAGVCKTGVAASCSAPGAPCLQAVCQHTGLFSHTCSVAAVADGTPCPDDAKACLLGATCAKGQCEAGDKPKLFVRSLPGFGGNAWFNGLAARADGSMVAVGGRAVAGGWRHWLVGAWSPLGQSLWQLPSSVTVTDSNHAAVAATAAVDGTVWVAGTWAAPERRARVIRLGVKGGVLRTVDTTWSKATVVEVTALAAVPTGGNVAVAVVTVGGVHKPALVRLSAAGNLVWKAVHAGAERITAAAAVVTGARVVLGGRLWSSLDPKTARWGHMSLSVVDGAYLTKDFPSAGKGQLLGGMAAFKDGAVAVGRAGGKAAGIRVLEPDESARIDAGTIPAGRIPSAMAASTDGETALVAGTSSGALGTHGWLAMSDSLGNLRWHRDVPAAGEAYLHAVAPLKDGVAAAGWVLTSAGQRWPLLVRAGAFGHSDCQSAGLCAQLTFKACDDGKPCTTDSCNAKIGCEHEQPIGWSCLPNDGCSRVGPCGGGKCLSAASGRLYNLQSTWPAQKDKLHYAVQATAKGGLVTWATWGTANAKVVVRQLHSPYGKATEPKTIPICNGLTYVRRIKPLFDGGIMVVGYRDYSSGARRGYYCRISKDDKVAWHGEQPTGDKNWAGVNASTQYEDGHIFVIGEVRTNKFVGNPWAVVVTKFSPAGKVLWSAVHGTADLNWTASNARGVPDGGAVTVGTAFKGWDKRAASLVGLSHDGKLRFLKVMAFKEGVSNFNGIAVDAAGTAVAAGTIDVNTTVSTTVAVAFDPTTGKVKWSKVQLPFDLGRGESVIALANGGTVVGGGAWLKGHKRIFMRRLDANGETLWLRHYLSAGVSDASMVWDGLGQWPGGLVAIGGPPANKSGQTLGYPLVIKTDHSGYAGCASSGKCLAKTGAACDDKNACTSDWCDATLGCQHQAIAGCK